MRRFKIFLLLLFVLILPRFVFSQAVRINYFGLQTFQSGPHARNITLGFGYEQNIWTKIAVSFEYNFGYSLGEIETTNESFYVLDANTGNSSSYNYILKTPWHEFAFYSKYFFRENSDNSWYISTGIAYRPFEYNIEITDYYNSGSQGLIPIGKSSKSGSSIPLSLKLGFRNNIEGMFGDYNFGVSYLAACDDFGTGNQLIDNALPEDDLRTLFFSFTCSFGFGWAK